MANSKISALTSATTPLAGTETLPIVQSSATTKVTVANLTAGRAVSAASVTTTGQIQSGGNIVSNTGYTIQKDLNTGFMRIIGGTSAGVDPTITMYGSGNGNSGLMTYDGSSHRIRDISGNTFLDVGTNTTNYGNFVQGTAAKGVNFTANTPAAGMTSQLLNWYEEGTWTPTLTFATAGNLAITYGRRTGFYTRIGNRVTVSFTIATDAFTWTTASGGARLTGLPFTQANVASNYTGVGIGVYGYTKANYTTITAETTPGTTYLQLVAYGSGQAYSALNAADLPSGTNKIIQGQITFTV